MTLLIAVLAAIGLFATGVVGAPGTPASNSQPTSNWTFTAVPEVGPASTHFVMSGIGCESGGFNPPPWIDLSVTANSPETDAEVYVGQIGVAEGRVDGKREGVWEGTVPTDNWRPDSYTVKAACVFTGIYGETGSNVLFEYDDQSIVVEEFSGDEPPPAEPDRAEFILTPESGPVGMAFIASGGGCIPEAWGQSPVAETFISVAPEGVTIESLMVGRYSAPTDEGDWTVELDSAEWPWWVPGSDPPRYEGVSPDPGQYRVSARCTHPGASHIVYFEYQDHLVTIEPGGPAFPSSSAPSPQQPKMTG